MFHLVFLKPSDHQLDLLAKIVQLKDSVKTLEGRPLIKAVRLIENQSEEGFGQGCQMGVMMLFEDAADLAAYHHHPEHEKVKQLVFQSIDVQKDLTVIDLQASDVDACLRTSP